MTDKDNLVGSQYGLLTIIDIVDTNKVKCRCECGNEIIFDLKKLKYGKRKSCGCLTSKSKLKDISGQRFGKLIAIEYTGKIKSHSAIWLCQCDCGNTVEVKVNRLSSGAIQSCGCLKSESRIKDLSNKRFGKLVAKVRTGKKKNNSQVWLCECDCGNTVEVSAGNLTSGKTNSCGCILDESRKKAIKKALDIRQEQYVEGTDIYQLAQEPRTNNTSGVVGVTYDKSTKTWKAKIEFKKKRYYLGSSKDIEVAIKLRKEAEEKLHGEFLEWYEMNIVKKNKK